MESIKSIKERLAARRPLYDASNPEHVKVRSWFDEHTGCDIAYLFYDGQIESMADFQERMTSRTAQLVSIAHDGFPQLVSRFQYRDKET